MRLVRLDGLLTHLDQVAVAPLLAASTPGARSHAARGPAPDRQAAGDRQHRHVGGVGRRPHQPAAEARGLLRSCLQLGHRVAGRGGQLHSPAGHVASRAGPAERAARTRPPCRVGPGAGQPGPGEVVAPVAAGQLVHDLEAAAAHRVGRRPADGAAGHVAVHPAREGVEDLAHELHPLCRCPAGRARARGWRAKRRRWLACRVLAASSLTIVTPSSTVSRSSASSLATRRNRRRAMPAQVGSPGSTHAPHARVCTIRNPSSISVPPA